MSITEDTPFVPEDDTYHAASSDHPLWVETVWWAWNVPERRIGGWLHAGYHANRNEVTWRVFAWDPNGADPGRLAYYKNMPDVPMPASPDLRDIVFPEGGFSVKMLTPLMDYHVAYQDAERRFGVEFEHRAVHPPQRFTPGEPPAMHNPHLDQLGHLKGELVFDGERIQIDCHSVRDRTWGPRTGHPSHGQKARDEGPARPHRVLHPGGARWRQIERERGRGRIQYIFGHSGAETGFLGFVRPQDGDAQGWSPMNVGWLLKDGVFQRLDKAKSRMKNYRDTLTGWSSHMQVELVDVTGRTMEAEGTTESHMCEHSAGSNALMRWEFEGRVGWGEDQDGWKLDHFNRMRTRCGPFADAPVKTGLFHGWKILAVMLMTQAFSAGMFVYGFSVFQIPIAEEFGASRSSVSLTISGGMLLNALLAPWIGRLIDRGPVGRIMLGCAIVMTLGYVSMSIVRSLPAVLVLYAVASAVGLQGLGNLVASKLMGNWFRRRRGRALGLAALGTSFGGLLAPPLLAYGVSRFGWRPTVGGAAISILLIVWGPILWTIRDHPRDLGLHPDGASESPPAATKGGVAVWPAKRLLREPGFVSLAVVLGVMMATTGTLIAHLPPIAMELGLAATPAAALISILSLAAIVGKLAFGFAAERVDARILLAIAVALLAGFVFMLTLSPPAHWVAAGAILPGLALGGVLPLWGAILGDYYGNESMGGAMGLMMPMTVLAQIAAMQLVPWVYDQYGSYAPAFRWLLGAFVIALFAMTTLRRPTAPA